MCLWGLVFAKAKACLGMTSLEESREVRVRYSQILRLSLIVIVCHGLKSSLESSFIKSAVELADNQFERLLF